MARTIRSKEVESVDEDQSWPPSKLATCRVREQLCRRSLPSEPDVTVSLHPAQAAAKPRVNRAGLHDGLNPGIMPMYAELLLERQGRIEKVQSCFENPRL